MCMYVYMYVCVYIHICVFVSVFLFLVLSIYPSIYLYLYIQQCAICSHLFHLLSSEAENSSGKDIVLEFRKYEFCHHMEIFKNLLFLCSLVFP